MIRFACPSCGARVFFEDQTCVRCGTVLRYDPGADAMTDGAVTAACRFAPVWACNWQAHGPDEPCAACSLIRTFSDPGPDLVPFAAAVRRVNRQLRSAGVDPAGAVPPLGFDLLRSTPDQPVTIGHADGLVTLDVAEGDPVQLTVVRTRLGEPYRTPLGHVRHESGHWHWQAVVAGDVTLLQRARELFGDEEADYQEALQRHYASLDDGSWRAEYVSHYATAHPWEDYAESFAHVLHLVAMVETAQAEGFVTNLDERSTFAERYRAWLPLTVSLNELARSMGTAEPYPFAPPEPAVAKMAFVAEILGMR